MRYDNRTVAFSADHFKAMKSLEITNETNHSEYIHMPSGKGLQANLRFVRSASKIEQPLVFINATASKYDRERRDRDGICAFAYSYGI